MYIFGYGSLIAAVGINGRGMSRVYTEEDIIEARLKGYRREWNAVYENNRFLGIVEDSESTVNGVIFQISEDDLPVFFDSEGISGPLCEYDPPMYDFVNVSGVCLNSGSPFQNVFTCVTHKPYFDGNIKPTYMEKILKCLQFRSPKFVSEFISTTVW